MKEKEKESKHFFFAFALFFVCFWVPFFPPLLFFLGFIATALHDFLHFVRKLEAANVQLELGILLHFIIIKNKHLANRAATAAETAATAHGTVNIEYVSRIPFRQFDNTNVYVSSMLTFY